MVGLPARGKSMIAGRIARYLGYFYGVPVKVVSLGSHRLLFVEIVARHDAHAIEERMRVASSANGGSTANSAAGSPMPPKSPLIGASSPSGLPTGLATG
eukprot:gene15263-65160_t